MSVLHFTHEQNINSKIPFFDVLVDANSYNLTASIYKKKLY